MVEEYEMEAEDWEFDANGLYIGDKIRSEAAKKEVEKLRATKPTVLTVDPDKIPKGAAKLPQWVLWKLWFIVNAKGKGSWTKVLLEVTITRYGSHKWASTTDPDSWNTFKNVLKAYQKDQDPTIAQEVNYDPADGIGLVATVENEIILLDLDNAFDSDGNLKPWAEKIINHFNTYTEVSPSGKGIRMLGWGKLPLKSRNKRDYEDGVIEIYDHARYVTITGARISHSKDLEEIQPEVDEFLKEYFPEKERSHWASGYDYKTSPTVNDDIIITMLLKEKSGRNKNLWEGKTDQIKGIKDSSQSGFDQSLVNKIAFYTQDPDQIDSIFRKSALCRDKWIEREDYRNRTIQNALDSLTDTWGTKNKVEILVDPDQDNLDDDEGWPDDIKDPEVQEIEAKPFHEGLLPDLIYKWVLEHARLKCCPADFMAASFMICIGALIGRKLRLYLSDDWYEYANEWACLVGPPGCKKSPPMNYVVAYLKNIEARNDEIYQEKMKVYKVDHAEWKLAMKKYEREYMAGKASGKPPFEPTIPIENLIWVSDANVPTMCKLLQHNPNGLMFTTDELDGWIAYMNASQHEADRSFFKSCKSGKEEYSLKRKSVESNKAKLLVSILGCYNPDALYSLVRAALGNDKDSALNDGLLQRFGFLVYPAGAIPTGIMNGKEVDEKQIVFIFDRMANIPSYIPGKGDLHLSESAWDIFDKWIKSLRERVYSNQIIQKSLLNHISKYEKTCPSIIIQLHVLKHAIKITEKYYHDEGSVDVPKLPMTISEDTVMCALKWMKYLETHAAKVYSIQVGATEDKSLEALMNNIKSGNIVSGMHIRDIYRKGWRDLNNSELVAAAINNLLPYGWIRVKRKPNNQGGATLVLHPKVTQMEG